MAEFICKIGTLSGEILQKTYSAESERVLRTEMEQQGYYVFQIRRKLAIREDLSALLSIRRRKVSIKEFLVFNQELAALIHSGLPLLRCLELLMERIGNQDFKRVLEDVYRQVKSGTSLSDAFSSHADVFPPVYTASILAGEKSATLEQVIRRYLNYVKIILAIRTKVISSLIYPLLLLALSCTVIGVLVGYVIPKFSSFYSDFAGNLPTITKILISTALFVRANAVWVIPSLVGLGLAVRIYLQTSGAARRLTDAVKLKLPVVGEMWTKFSVSQLTRMLSTLLAGGIPLVNAIDVAANSVGNELVSEQLSRVSQGVKEGATLWSSLEKTGLMPHMTIEMVKVGEETGSLEEMLRNISDFYDEEISTNLTNVLAVVEPMMLILMGLVIATILLAMYYPLFSAYSVIR